jgi:hypothetical protein
MTSFRRPGFLLRRGFFSLALVVGLCVSQRPAFAATGLPAMTIDFTQSGVDINNALATPSLDNMAVTSANSGATETFDVWVVITPGTSGATDAQLGIVNAYWGARATLSPTDNGYTISGTVGAVQATSAYQSPFESVSSFTAGEFASHNSNGVTDISSITVKSSTTEIESDGGTGAELGNGSDGGEALTNGGWAWQVATVTFKLPTINATGSGAITVTPAIPTFATNNNWTFGSGNVSNSSTPTAYPTQVGSAITYTMQPSATNSSVLKLSPTSLTFNLMTGAPAPATQNLSLQETTGTSGNNATYTGTAANGFSIANGASGTVNAGATNLLAVGYTGSTATPGTFSANYTVTNTSGSSATQGNLAATLTAKIGNAAADVSGNGTFGGDQMMAGMAEGSSYAGLSASAATSYVGNGTGGAGLEHSVATILMGTNSGNWITGNGGLANVGITFRNRMLSETPNNDNVNGMGYPNGNNPNYGPPLNGLPLISDVARLYGMNSNATASTTATVQTDPFVFQMSFNPATMLAEGATPADLATRGNVYLASLLGATPSWQNTIDGDFAVSEATTTSTATVHGVSINVGIDAAAAMPNGVFTKPYIGTFAQWESQNPGFNSGDIADYIGVFGVDPNGDNAWAIINHNSDFAVVPEPSTFILAAFGLLGGALALRRKKTLAAA